MHHSSTSTYKPNVIEIKETFCGWTDGQVDGHLRPTLLGQLREVDLKMGVKLGQAQIWGAMAPIYKRHWV